MENYVETFQSIDSEEKLMEMMEEIESLVRASWDNFEAIPSVFFELQFSKDIPEVG